jgi:transposase
MLSWGDILKRLVILQKKTFGYIEANAEKRSQFLEEIASIDPSKIVYSDETGIDDNEVSTTGWAPQGKRCYAQKKAERKTRYNITAALCMNKLLAPFIFEGYSNSAVYETYIEQVLIPVLKPGMVFVIDNARFHKSKKVIELIEAVGCRVLFLPPYSPDLNPIEHFWFSIKNTIRTAAQICTDFYETAVKVVGEMCNA